eukprot:scaffold13765_cov64-Phaeocystis_antarctica.AAC.4
MRSRALPPCRALLRLALASDDQAACRAATDAVRRERGGPVHEGLSLPQVDHQKARPIEAVKLILDDPVRALAINVVREIAAQHGHARQRDRYALAGDLDARFFLDAQVFWQSHDHLHELVTLSPPQLRPLHLEGAALEGARPILERRWRRCAATRRGEA